jgi:hypothetical protein
MVIVLVALVLIVPLAPAYGIAGRDAATGLASAVVAVVLVTMAGALGVGTSRHLTFRLRSAPLLMLIVPLAWMLLQVAPIPLDSFCDAVWPSASAALNQPIAGSISVDTGATLLSIVWYCGALATATIVAMLASDRQSAAKMLYLVAIVPGLVGGADVAHEFGLFWFFRSGGEDRGSTVIAAIGIIVSCSLLIQLRRQQSSRRTQPTRVTIALVCALAVFMLCTLSLLVRNDTNVLFAAFFGAGVPISMFAIRRWSLRTWGTLGALAAAVMVLAGFLAVTPIQPHGDPTLALVQHSSPAAELMVSDAPLLGRGAGSVKEIFPVYSDIDERFSPRLITTAAIMSVEMGRVFLWIFIFTLAVGAWLLMKASLNRGRDYVYAANGAGILVAVSLLSFVNSDVLSLPASLLASAALGLAWAQARSDHDMKSVLEPPGPASVLRDERPWPLIRVACALFGLVLMAQACWILIPVFYTVGLRAEGTGLANSSLVESEDLNRAASLALVRGDLWAKSALASAAVAESNPAAAPVDDRVRQRLVNALLYAPYQAKIWLRLAELADKFKWTGYDIRALLKMVYFTGPNDISLVPGRTRLALHLNGTAVDLDLRDLVERDLELILRRRPELRPALVTAYQSANPQGRALADGVIARTDPPFLRMVEGQ